MANPLIIDAALSSGQVVVNSRAMTLLVLAVISIPLLVHSYLSWHRLSHVPGPITAQFFILWIVKRVWSGKLFPSMVEAGEKYGELMLI
jgi:hypothetical protein